jgi:hypothetical protein
MRMRGLRLLQTQLQQGEEVLHTFWISFRGQGREFEVTHACEMTLAFPKELQ